MKEKIPILILVSFLIFGQQKVVCQEIKYIKSKKANIREYADKKAPIISKVTQNEEVEIITVEGNWSQVKTKDGNAGYIFSSLLTNENINSKGKNNTSWVVYALGIAVFLYIIAQILGFIGNVLGFFEKIFSNKSASKNDNSEQKLQKKQKMCFFCKWCGTNYPTIQSLTNTYCPYNPEGKKHALYEGAEKAKYDCKFCGATYKTIKDLTLTYCNKSPHKKHHPTL